MAHRTEGPDHQDLGGGIRRHKTTPGGQETIINKDFANMAQEEICGAVEDAGLAVRASGAADESAGWGQLTEAIKILSNQKWNDNVSPFKLVATDHLIDGDPFEIIPGGSYNRIHGAGLNNGQVTIFEDNQLEDRFIIVENDTDTVKRIGSSGNLVSVRPNCIMIFKYNNGNDSGFKWVPLNPLRTTTDLEEGQNLYWTQERFTAALLAAIAAGIIPGNIDISFPIGIYLGSTNIGSVIGDARYVRNGKKITLYIPRIVTGNFTYNSAFVHIKGPTGGALPVGIAPVHDAAGYTANEPILSQNAGVLRWGSMGWTSGKDSIFLQRLDANWETGTIIFTPKAWSYLLP